MIAVPVIAVPVIAVMVVAGTAWLFSGCMRFLRLFAAKGDLGDWEDTAGGPGLPGFEFVFPSHSRAKQSLTMPGTANLVMT